SWACKKQQAIALSSSEAEYMGSGYNESVDSLASTVIDRVSIPTGFTNCTL
ncbi:hypothetical protein KI387_039705, partial [Taxus chinensis]